MSKFQRTLAQGLHFTAADLTRNRNGNLSQEQIPLLKRKRNWNLVINGLAGPFFSGIGLILLMIALDKGMLAQSRICASSLFIWFVLAALFFVNESVHFWRHIRRDIEDGITKSIQGRVVLKMSGASGKVRYVTYSLRVNDVEFSIDEAAFRSFKDLEPYRLY
jgi:hypothetical protein